MNVKPRTYHLLLLLALCLTGIAAKANKVTFVGNPEIVFSEDRDGVAHVKFGIYWENSWRLSQTNNWDAVWVFFKYRRDGDDWKHIYLDTLASNHFAGEASDNTIDPQVKIGISTFEGRRVGVGAFLYRGKEGYGLTQLLNVKLRWNYREQDIDDFESLNLRSFAIEMVYIPEGAFYVGDGWNETYQADYQYPENGTSQIPAYLLNNLNVLTRSYASSNKGFSGRVFNDSVIYEQFKTIPTTTVKLTNPCTAGVSGNFTTWSAMPKVTTAIGSNFTFNSGTGQTITAKVSVSKPNYYASATYNALSDTAHKYPWVPKDTAAAAWEYFELSYNKGFRANSFTTHFYVKNSFAHITGFYLAASKDGSSWDTLFGSADTDKYNWTENTKEFNNRRITATPDYYTYYRFYIYGHHNSGGDDFGLSYVGLTNSNGLCGNWEGDDEILETNLASLRPNLVYSHKPFQINEKNYNRLNFCPAANTETMNYGGVRINANYPSGYQAFYAMKYEISQHAYVDFLNSLSSGYQNIRVPSTISPFAEHEGNIYTFTGSNSNVTPADNLVRNYVHLRRKAGLENGLYGMWNMIRQQDLTYAEPYEYEEHGGNLPMVGLSWRDVIAYLDWAGLRPLTELEYEKMCRGPKYPLNKEYAWGSPLATATTAVPKNADGSNETAAEDAANSVKWGNYSTWPIRVGCFGGKKQTRQSTGAGYYGVMNLSDNANERYVNISTDKGRAYTGTHGNGVFGIFMEADEATWPTDDNAVGTGYRGACFSSDPATNSQIGAVSERTYIELTQSGRYLYQGGRGGRTAPR